MDTDTFRQFFWDTVVPEAYPHIGAYPMDLLIHDRDQLVRKPEMYFILAIGATGTNLISIVDFCAMPDTEQIHALRGSTKRFLLCPAANWICPII